jgi:hypothetical protein
VVNLGVGLGHATSGTYGIGGVSASGHLSYDSPFFVSFFNPANTAQQATTSSFSIRNDNIGLGACCTMTLLGYDVFGALLGQASFPDNSGSTLSLNLAGMHRVEVRGTTTTAFDDVTFGQLTPFVPVASVPEPATLLLLLPGLAAVGLVTRRRSPAR